MLVMATSGFVPPLLPRDRSLDAERFAACGRQHPPDQRAELLRQDAADVDAGFSFVVPDFVARNMFTNLLVAPISLVPKGNGKFRRIMNASYGIGPRDSLNAVTDLEAMHPVEFAHALDRILKRVYELWLSNPGGQVMLLCVDITNAFKNLPVHPDWAPVMAHRCGGLTAVQLRGVFGWSGTPSLFDLWAQAISHRMAHSDMSTPVSEEARSFVQQHVHINRPATGVSPVRPKPDEAATRQPVQQGDKLSAVFHVDDGTAAEMGDDAFLLKVSMVLVECIFQAFGFPSGERPCAVNTEKLLQSGGWSWKAKVLGVILDMVHMTVTLPQDKLDKLTDLIFQLFPRTRATATVRDIQVLLGNLRYLALVVRPGRFFLWELQRVLNRAGTDNHPLAVLQLDEGFHADLDWWRWLVGQVQHRTVSLEMPMWFHVVRPAAFEIYSDASGWGCGGCCELFKVCWRLQWSAEISSLFNSSADEALFINELELAGMMLNVYVLLLLDSRAVPGEAVSVRGDNSSAVHWMQAAGTSRASPAAEIMRVLGALEILSGMSFRAKHIAGIKNELADALSRADKRSAAGTAVCPVPVGFTQLMIPQQLSEATFEMLLRRCGVRGWLQALP